MSRTAKINRIPLTVFFAFMALVFASFWLAFNSFSPEQKYLKLCALVSVLFGLFAPWIMLRYPGTDRAREDFFARSLANKILSVVIAALFAALGLLTILCLGIGYIATDLLGEAESLPSTVVEVSSGRYKRRSCDHFYRVETSDNRHFKFCTKPRLQNQWREGELVNIYVKHSKLGYIAMKSNNSFKPTPLRGVGKAP